MTTGALGSRIAKLLTFRLLAVLLIILTLLPLLVFAIDLPNRAPVRAAREAVLSRTGTKPDDSSLRQERSRESRASRRPTMWGALSAMLVQLVWICLIAWVGRRGFGLRL